jgi:hypothetical protein
MNSIIALLNKMDWFAGNKRILGVVLLAVGAAAEATLGALGMAEFAGIAGQVRVAGEALLVLGIATDAARPA